MGWKVMQSLCSPWRYMGGMWAKLHSFLTSPIDGCERSNCNRRFSPPGRFWYWREGCVGPTAIWKFWVRDSSWNIYTIKRIYKVKYRCRFITVSSSDPAMNYYYSSAQKLQIQHNCIQWHKYHYFSAQKDAPLTPTRKKKTPAILHQKVWIK